MHACACVRVGARAHTHTHAHTRLHIHTHARAPTHLIGAAGPERARLQHAPVAQREGRVLAGGVPRVARARARRQRGGVAREAAQQRGGARHAVR